MDRGPDEEVARTLVLLLGSEEIARQRLADRAIVIGSGPDADIRIEPRGVRPRHVEVRIDPEGLRLSPVDRECRLLSDGEPVTGDLVLGPNQSVHVGLYELRLESSERERATLSGPQRERIGAIELVVGGKSARVFPVHDGAKIGRNLGCWIPVDDPDVSSEHALFYMSAGGPSIKDLGSRNGTRVRGELIADTLLRSGDEIGIGRFLFRFRREDERVREAPRSGMRGAMAALLAAVFALTWVVWEGQVERRPSPEVAIWEASVALDAGEVERAKRMLPRPERVLPDSLIATWETLLRRITAAEARLEAEAALVKKDGERAIDRLAFAHRLDPDDSATTELLRESVRARLREGDGRPEAALAPIEAPSGGFDGAPTARRRDRKRRNPVPSDVDPLQIRWVGPSRVHLGAGEKIRLSIEAEPGESRPLRCTWSAEWGRLTPEGMACVYFAPTDTLGLVDHVKAEVEASGGARRVLRATITTGGAARIPPADPEAERAFWSGYRL
ncbi:MAG: hypothetical protein CME06_14300, partial [Gemmatimonadetes bacterium]|nr:hypothetical protein [Gemmatimonadota bacterium]